MYPLQLKGALSSTHDPVELPGVPSGVPVTGQLRGTLQNPHRYKSNMSFALFSVVFVCLFTGGEGVPCDDYPGCIGPNPLCAPVQPPSCHWHLVTKTGYLFRLVHLRTLLTTSPSPPVLTSGGWLRTVDKRAGRTLLECFLVTGRNEVVAKVIFLHLFVILFTGGFSSRENPPCQGEPPLPGRTPPRQGEPPRSRHPPRKQTPAYGLRAAGTHPTGMHSCLY